MHGEIGRLVDGNDIIIFQNDLIIGVNLWFCRRFRRDEFQLFATVEDFGWPELFSVKQDVSAFDQLFPLIPGKVREAACQIAVEARSGIFSRYYRPDNPFIFIHYQTFFRKTLRFDLKFPCLLL